MNNRLQWGKGQLQLQSQLARDRQRLTVETGDALGGDVVEGYILIKASGRLIKVFKGGKEQGGSVNLLEQGVELKTLVQDKEGDIRIFLVNLDHVVRGGPNDNHGFTLHNKVFRSLPSSEYGSLFLPLCEDGLLFLPRLILYAQPGTYELEEGFRIQVPKLLPVEVATEEIKL